jgi:hypothetical protein
LDVVELFVEYRVERRWLVKREAKALLRRDCGSAYDTAQRVADLARTRSDPKTAKLWDDIALEMARKTGRAARETTRGRA